MRCWLAAVLPAWNNLPVGGEVDAMVVCHTRKTWFQFCYEVVDAMKVCVAHLQALVPLFPCGCCNASVWHTHARLGFGVATKWFVRCWCVLHTRKTWFQFCYDVVGAPVVCHTPARLGSVLLKRCLHHFGSMLRLPPGAGGVHTCKTVRMRVPDIAVLKGLRFRKGLPVSHTRLWCGTSITQ